MFDFIGMPSKDMIVFATALSIPLIEGLDADRQLFWGNVLLIIGQNLTSASAQEQFLSVQKQTKAEFAENTDSDSESNSESDMEEIKNMKKE